jgi:hypothetical protein
MDLAITSAQRDAVLRTRNLPDVLKKVLDSAKAKGPDFVLHLTYEEATALNELCSWNVHTDPAGNVTKESQPFDDVVRAIMMHPDY